jgi:signal peptidase II
MSPRRRRGAVLLVVIAVACVGIAIDQVAKALAVAHLTAGQPISLVSDIFQLQLLRNSGAAFSAGSGMTMVFSILALVVLVAVIVLVVPRVRSMFWAIIVGLGLAGVAGNFIDRLVRSPGPFRGHVVDFFALKHFAVFNVADVFLTVAAVLIVLDAVFFRIDFDGERTGRSDDDQDTD